MELYIHMAFNMTHAVKTKHESQYNKKGNRKVKNMQFVDIRIPMGIRVHHYLIHNELDSIRMWGDKFSVHHYLIFTNWNKINKT